MSQTCPSCSAPVPAGETICLECGTELVFVREPSAPAPAPEAAAPEEAADAVAELAAEPAAESVSAAEPEAEAPCPDCGELVSADANGLCPVCGFDLSARVDIDEAAFFAPPLSLDETLERERARAEQLARGRAHDVPPRLAPSPPAASFGPAGGGDGGAAYVAQSAATGGAAAEAQRSGASGAPMPLPSERSRVRYRQDSRPQAVAEAAAWVFVDGQQSVFFDGRMTHKLRLDVDELTIGRRDPSAGHYPDIDLAHLRHIDGHISRRHARLKRRAGQWYIEDLCDNDATFLNDQAHVLNREEAPLSDGDRIMISDSLALLFRVMRG